MCQCCLWRWRWQWWRYCSMIDDRNCAFVLVVSGSCRQGTALWSCPGLPVPACSHLRVMDGETLLPLRTRCRRMPARTKCPVLHCNRHCVPPLPFVSSCLSIVHWPLMMTAVNAAVDVDVDVANYWKVDRNGSAVRAYLQIRLQRRRRPEWASGTSAHP